MIRNLIRLVVFLAIANAIYQVAPPALHQFQFKDAVHDLALFAPRKDTDEQIIDKVMALAEENKVPLEREYVTVQRSNDAIKIKATYIENLKLLPGYSFPWQVDVDVTVLK